MYKIFFCLFLLLFKEFGYCENGDIIATVNDENVFMKDIIVSKETAMSSFKFFFKKEPNEEELKAFIVKNEIENLKNKISEIIYDKAIKKQITEEKKNGKEKENNSAKEETNKEIESIIKNIKQEDIEQFNKRMNLLISVLKTVVKNPTESKKIYEQSNIKEFIPLYEGFIYYTKTFNTIEKVDKFQRNLPKTKEDLASLYRDKMAVSLIHMKEERMTYKNFNDNLVKEIKINDEEVQNAYNKRYLSYADRINNTFESKKEELKEELLDKRKKQVIQEYWIRQYRVAKIRIYDERFKPVIEYFKNIKEILIR